MSGWPGTSVSRGHDRKLEALASARANSSAVSK